MSDELTELRARVEQLETALVIVAAGILQHEYAKDLDRYGIHTALRHISDDKNFPAAIEAVKDGGLI